MGRNTKYKMQEVADIQSTIESVPGISSPSIKVDVAGAVFLTGEPVSVLGLHLRERE